MPESAKVEILVDAFTEAAQEAVEQVGDSLNNLSADAQPAQSAMNEVGDELNDASSSAVVAGQAMDSAGTDATQLAAAMQALQSRADEAGDEVAQAGAKAGVTSALFSRLTVSTNGLAFSMGTLSTVATLSLIPSLLTLSTALLPLAGILGGAAAAAVSLAAVFGGLAAVGVVTHMEELKAAFEDASAAIMDIVEPLGEVFGPLLVDAVEALPELVRRIVESLGPLDQFANTLRELGAQAMDVIPAMTGVMFDLAQTALPVLIDVIEELRRVGPGMMSAISDALDTLDGPLSALGGALGDLLPTLFDVGVITADLVLPALTSITQAIDQVAEFVLSLDQNLRRLAVAGAITAPAIFGIASSLGTLLGPLGLVAAAVAGFVAAYRSNFMGLRDITNAAIREVMDVLRAYADIARETLGVAAQEARRFASAFQESFRSAAGGAVGDLTDNVQGMTDQVITLLSDAGDALTPIFRQIGTVLTQNADTFATFGRMAVQALNGLVSIVRGVVLPVLRFVFMNFTIPLLQRVVNVWSRHFGTILTETIETINALVSYIRPVLNALEAFWSSHGQAITQTVRFAFDAIIGVIGTAVDAIYTAIIVVLNLIQGDWEEAWTAIRSFAQRTLDGLRNFFETWDIVGAIRGVLRDVASAFGAFFFNALPNALIQALASMLTMLQTWGNSVRNLFVTIFNGVINIATNALQNFINMVIDAINQFLSTLDDVADAVSEIPGVDAPDVGSLNQVNLSSQAIQAEQRQVDQQAATRRNEQTIRAVLDVRGDNPLADFIRDQTQTEVERSEREKTRRSRRQNATGVSR